jgi:hypothetical protein
MVAAFLLAAVHAPAWTMVATCGAIAISIVLAVTVVSLRNRGDGGESGGEDEDGGLGRRPPERPSGGGGPAEPSWWPEFERELRRYMEERRRTTRADGERPRRLVTR